MTGYRESREVLSMDKDNSAASLSFGKKNGCFVSRGVFALLGLLFVSAIIATALLVYYYAPQPNVIDDGGSGDATTPGTDVEAKPYVRLPRSIKPIQYVVKLQPFINGNFSILGHVDIELEVLEPTTNISLHIADIITKNETIKLVPADELQGEGITIKEHAHDDVRDFYIAHLNEALEKGKYVLSMDFEGYLNDQLHGFYRSSYLDDQGNKVWIASTQFQPTDARRAFPCFDEPALKAKFEIYLGRQENMTSISNMPKFETIPIEGQEGWYWDHFNTSVPVSTYLVAFVVSDFVHMNSTYNDHVLFRVWSREEAIQQADYALKSGPAILTFFEDYFKVPFPLPKSDMIAIPDFAAGAMENWGLITYRETAMLYDPKVSAAFNKQRVLIVVAHELAHQWFGNLVTPSWWTDLWLNEGFASFMEYVGSNAYEKEWLMLEQVVIDDLQDVFALDCLETSHPISIPVGHPDEINEIFDRISYGKGSSIIRMMNFFLTEATFTKGLSNYLNDLKFSSAEQDDLWRFLTEAGHEDGNLPNDLTIKQIMDTWTLQMGYPVIKVTRSEDGTSATVSQERFLLVKNENSTDTHDYKWWVPLSYTNQDKANFNDTNTMIWMKDTDTEITVDDLPSKDKWVIFNIQETGYYRVNYDDNNWKLLIQQLKTNHKIINVINRAQIIDDALDLARAGQLSYPIALDINSYLSKETEYIPLAATLNNMGYIYNMFTKAKAYGALKKYLLDLVVPIYNSVGFVDNVDDPHLVQLKRIKVVWWSCSMGHVDCIDNSVNLYKQWMANPSDTSIISPNLKSTVYCTAIKNGGEEEWNFAWEQYLKSNVGSEKNTLISAMGCSKKIWILSRYLELAFMAGNGIKKQDAARVFGAVAGNDVGKSLAWSFLRDQWQSISEYFGSGLFAIANIVKSGTGSFNSNLELQELELFRDTYKSSLKTATRAVDQSIENTRNNIAWMEHNYNVIVDWLEENGYSSKLKSI